MEEKREKQNLQKRILFLHEKTYEYEISSPVPREKFWPKKNSCLLTKLRILGKQCPTPGGAKLIRVAATFSTFFALTVEFGPNLNDKEQKKYMLALKSFALQLL